MLSEEQCTLPTPFFLTQTSVAVLQGRTLTCNFSRASLGSSPSNIHDAHAMAFFSRAKLRQMPCNSRADVPLLIRLAGRGLAPSRCFDVLSSLSSLSVSMMRGEKYVDAQQTQREREKEREQSVQSQGRHAHAMAHVWNAVHPRQIFPQMPLIYMENKELF